MTPPAREGPALQRAGPCRLADCSFFGWITTSAPIFAPHSLDSAVTTGLGSDTKKRTVSSAQIQEFRLAIVSPSRNSSRFLRSASDQGWFKGGGGKCCFGPNPATIGTVAGPRCLVAVSLDLP